LSTKGLSAKASPARQVKYLNPGGKCDVTLFLSKSRELLRVRGKVNKEERGNYLIVERSLERSARPISFGPGTAVCKVWK
jgi:hypothetical protein